jgi:hypothetical protein
MVLGESALLILDGQAQTRTAAVVALEDATVDRVLGLALPVRPSSPAGTTSATSSSCSRSSGRCAATTSWSWPRTARSSSSPRSSAGRSRPWVRPRSPVPADRQSWDRLHLDLQLSRSTCARTPTACATNSSPPALAETEALNKASDMMRSLVQGKDILPHIQAHIDADQGAKAAVVHPLEPGTRTRFSPPSHEACG